MATSAALTLLFAESATAVQFKYPFGTMAAQVREDDHPKGNISGGHKGKGSWKAIDPAVANKNAWEAKYTL